VTNAARGHDQALRQGEPPGRLAASVGDTIAHTVPVGRAAFQPGEPQPGVLLNLRPCAAQRLKRWRCVRRDAVVRAGTFGSGVGVRGESAQPLKRWRDPAPIPEVARRLAIAASRASRLGFGRAWVCRSPGSCDASGPIRGAIGKRARPRIRLPCSAKRTRANTGEASRP
jgi:hypothetical protein